MVGIEVSGVTWMGLNAQVFLTERPEMDKDTRSLRLRDVKIDVESEAFLLRVAAFVLETPFEAAIAKRVALPLGSALDAVLAELADTSISLKVSYIGETVQDLDLQNVASRLSLNLIELELEKLWTSEGTLNAAVSAAGRSRVSVK